jgi:hypothetical protein
LGYIGSDAAEGLGASSFKGDYQYINLHGVAYVVKATAVRLPIALLLYFIKAPTPSKFQQLRAVAMLVLVHLKKYNKQVYLHT